MTMERHSTRLEGAESIPVKKRASFSQRVSKELSRLAKRVGALPARAATVVRQVKNGIATRANPRVVSLTPDELLVRTIYGFQMVVPGWNVDVGIGIVRAGIIEPWTNAVVLDLLGKGDHFINVGANFGYYAALAAQRVERSGKVYAVEANPVVFPFLVKTAYWSGFPDTIRMFNCAAAGPEMHGKQVEFLFDPQFIGGGSMSAGISAPRPLHECFWSKDNIHEALGAHREFIAKGVFSSIKAECQTLDSFIPHDIPLKAMLIDAEGSECHVIAGAKETIRRHPKMAIVMEWAPVNALRGPEQMAAVEAMWDFLLGEMAFQAHRICPEGYRGVGTMPRLEAVSREGLKHIPHSDLLLRKS